MIDITRRQALAGMGSLGASIGLSACSTPITPFCPTDPTISDPSAPLTIDVHTHVFNGSDLQIDGFFRWVVLRNTQSELGEILQELGRDFAPTAAEEMAALQQIDSVTRTCDVHASSLVLQMYGQERYTRGKDALKAALRSVRARGVRRFRSSTELERQISSLPERYSDYRAVRRRKARLATENVTEGDIDFILRNFQYRYVNVYEYLLEYSQGRTRRIDLLVAHLVDFDWPIGNGIPTPTSLGDQVRIMERISQLAGGRVLCFAPFDPLKEVAFTLGLTTESSFQLVTDAVTNHGFVGVKLYPPMGFAPLGNTSFDNKGFWNRPWIPQSLQRSDLGRRMDGVLSNLYSWCLANGVPIMGHASATNGPSDGPNNDFQNLTLAKRWEPVPTNFPGIRIDFGHYGYTDLTHTGQENVFSSFMRRPSGQFLYADSAYFADLLTNPVRLQADLASLLQNSSGYGDAALAQRLMYGTDWEMIVREGPASDRYLERFEAIFSSLDHLPVGAQGKLSDRFFGVNAAIFLGLRTGQPNRNRLDAYYGIGPKPAWMSKVDNLPMVA